MVRIPSVPQHPSAPQYDDIVIGVGGMGSAALYHLARRGRRVLGIERFDIPHDLGSSHGVNRIIRLAYAEHPDYVPLLRRAYELWRELEHVAGERLLVITGGLDAGTETSPMVTGSRRACAIHHLPHEVLDAAALRRRFPGCAFPPEIIAVYQADAGFVLSGRSIVAHVNAALARGGEVHARERVMRWDADGDGVEVHTDRGRYRARRLVITAGPWVGEMVPALARLAVPERQVLIWTQPRTPALFLPGAFPVCVMDVPEGRFYSFPIFGVPGFKIGKYHHRLEQVLPDTMDRECHPEDEVVLREGIRKYFPDADGPTLALKTCLFTNTPDEHFVIGLHPERAQVAVAGGFSGHGFKFCSVVGEILADLAIDGATRWSLDLFRFDRFSS